MDRRKRRGRKRAADALEGLECGCCCLSEVSAVALAVALGARVAWRRRR